MDFVYDILERSRDVLSGAYERLYGEEDGVQGDEVDEYIDDLSNCDSLGCYGAWERTNEMREDSE